MTGQTLSALNLIDDALILGEAAYAAWLRDIRPRAIVAAEDLTAIGILAADFAQNCAWPLLCRAYAYTKPRAIAASKIAAVWGLNVLCAACVALYALMDTAIAAPVPAAREALELAQFDRKLAAPKTEVKAEPDYKGMSAVALRQLCSDRAIAWRNAHGRNKHLSKQEMISLLGLTQGVAN